MNVDDVRLLVQTVEARNEPTPSMLPATVASFSFDTNIATVVLDGDPPDSTVEAKLLVGEVGSGDRTMVYFDPPAGVYAIGSMGQGPATGNVIAFSKIEIGNPIFLTEADPDVSKQVEISWRKNRFYKVSLFAAGGPDYDNPNSGILLLGFNVYLNASTQNVGRSGILRSWFFDVQTVTKEEIYLEAFVVPENTEIGLVDFYATTLGDGEGVLLNFDLLVQDLGHAAAAIEF